MFAEDRADERARYSKISFSENTGAVINFNLGTTNRFGNVMNASQYLEQLIL